MLDNLDLRNRQADAEHIVSYPWDSEMGEIDTKPMIKSFICLFLFQIEDFVFKWLRNRFQVLLTA